MASVGSNKRRKSQTSSPSEPADTSAWPANVEDIPNSTTASPLSSIRAGRPRQPYSQQANKVRVKQEAWNALLEIASGGKNNAEAEAHALLGDLHQQHSSGVGISVEDKSLARNCRDLFASSEVTLGDVNSHIAAFLTRGLTSRRAAEITHVNHTSIWKLWKEFGPAKVEQPAEDEQDIPEEDSETEDCDGGDDVVDEDSDELVLRGPVPDHRAFPAWSSWILLHAPVRSGTLKRRYLLWGMWCDAYDAYKAQVDPPRCGYMLFRLWCWRAYVRRAKFDKYLCALCYDQRILDAEGHAPSARYIAHRELVEIQTKYYHEHLSPIPSDTIVLIMDFGKFHETKKWKLNCLCFVGLVADENAPVSAATKNFKKISARYFDYFSTANQRYHFVDAGMKRLKQDLDFSRYKKVSIWADAGMRKMGTVRAAMDFQQTFWDRRKRKYTAEVELIFFAPYHGHSRADGHIGRVKQSIKQAYAGKLLTEPQEVVDVAAHMKNTTAILLPVAEGQERSWEGWQPGIRLYLKFTFPEEEVVMCYSHVQKKKGVINTLD